MEKCFDAAKRITCGHCDFFEPLDTTDKFIGISGLGFCKLCRCCVDDDDICTIDECPMMK